METFKEFIDRQDEGLFGGLLGRGQAQQPAAQAPIPGVLAYHIADAINGAMIQAGRMPSPQPHRPFGDVPGDTSYDPAMKSRLRDMFYGKAKQMLAAGDIQGLLDYFGFDAQRGRPVGPGRFVADLQTALKGAA